MIHKYTGKHVYGSAGTVRLQKTTITMRRPKGGLYWAAPKDLGMKGTPENLLAYEQELLRYGLSGGHDVAEEADVIHRWATGQPLKELYVVIPKPELMLRLKQEDWQHWHQHQKLGNCFYCDSEEEALELFNKSVAYTKRRFDRSEVEIEICGGLTIYG